MKHCNAIVLVIFKSIACSRIPLAVVYSSEIWKVLPMLVWRKFCLLRTDVLHLRRGCAVCVGRTYTHQPDEPKKIYCPFSIALISPALAFRNWSTSALKYAIYLNTSNLKCFSSLLISCADMRTHVRIFITCISPSSMSLLTVLWWTEK